MDFIEFVFKHIHDVQNGQYHDYFKHYELTFPSTNNTRIKYILDINEIFRRNNIAFQLNDSGEIQRILDKELNNLIETTIEPKDDTLSGLLYDATTKIISPRIEERKIAVERLWDAFERLKTIINPNKKDSANQLLEKISKGNQKFKSILETECMTSLTSIGNEFQIRHFETDKIAIEDTRHLDYLFFRMYALIHLLLTEI